MSLDDVVIVSALRTPITRAKRGGFKDTPANDLLVAVLVALLDQTGVEPEVRSPWLLQDNIDEEHHSKLS